MNDPDMIVNTESNPKPKKLLERAREILRVQHYSIRTEDAYLG
jgi:hypothetical protein